jgi:hypothetical protein
MLDAKSLLIAAVAVAAYAGCGDNRPALVQQITETKAPLMTTELLVKLGEMGPAFAKRYPDIVRVVRQPAGVDFYRINWERPSGVVRIEHTKHSFVVEHASGVSSSQDLEEFKSEGLNEFNIFAGISAPELIPHDEARLKIHAILRRIMDAGWKSTTSRSRPRLSGQARVDYVLNTSSSIGLDPAHMPTFDEWMRIENRTSWGMYADGVFLDVTFTREPTLTDPKKPGAYLLSFNLKTATEFFRGYAGPDDRLRWKAVLPQELAKAAAARAQKETELRAKGIKIDESYQDPPVPAFK